MKKRSALVLTVILSLLMGCGKADAEDVKPVITESIPTPTAAVAAVEAEPSEEIEQEAVEEETQEPEPQIVELTQTYTVRIRQDDFPIYDGPGYGYARVHTEAPAGVYTIVAECRDEEGTLWGRLKSGVGWVNVSAIEQGTYAPTPTPVPKEGCCIRCGVELTDTNTAFEGFGLCERCYDETLPDSARCDNCGMDCSFAGKEAGLCPNCFDEKYPNGRYNCTKCGTAIHTQGWCADCSSKYCPMCGGPDGEGHNCDDYPNVFCPNSGCGWSMHTTGVGTDGIVCPKCGTRII